MVPGIALDGALIHARDAKGVPVGNFTDKGGIFKDFPGCGKNAEGSWNGVVHSMLITCNVSCLPSILECVGDCGERRGEGPGF